MAQTEPSNPTTPIPATHSTSRNLHRLTRLSPTVLLLEPGRSLWVQAWIFLALLALVLAFCIARRTDNRLTIGLALGPAAAAGGLAVAAFCFQRYGTCARFDGDLQRIVIKGARHGAELEYALTDVQAVQLCDAGSKGDEGSWRSYQVNLVLRSGSPDRVNLLDSGDEEDLRRIAQEIAGFLGVPLLPPPRG